MSRMRLLVLLAVLFTLSPAPKTHAQRVPASRPIRVVIVGLVHGHVRGFLHALPQNHDATLVGIVEPDTALAAQYRTE